MRMLRLSLVGTVTLTLLGGWSAVVTAQEAPGGVYVTGTAECIEPPGRTIQDDGAVELHVFRNECTFTSSDPRLSGTGVYDIQQFCLKEETGHVCMGRGTGEVAGPDGTWVGTWSGLGEPAGGASFNVTTEGTGDYTGWTFMAVLREPFDGTPAAVHGLIFEGAPPPQDAFTPAG